MTERSIREQRRQLLLAPRCSVCQEVLHVGDLVLLTYHGVLSFHGMLDRYVVEYIPKTDLRTWMHATCAPTRS